MRRKLNKPGKSLMQPRKACLLWLNTYRYHTEMYTRLRKYLAVTESWFISVCGFCLCGITNSNSRVSWFLGMKDLLRLLQRCWVGRTGPIPWPGRSCEFLLMDIVLWDYVKDHVYIRPFGILLMERHTDAEYVLMPALLLDYTQHTVVIPLGDVLG